MDAVKPLRAAGDIPPEQCCFVGDDLQWDVEGAAGAGMWPILIDRDKRFPAQGGARATDLWEVVSHLERRNDARRR